MKIIHKITIICILFLALSGFFNVVNHNEILAGNKAVDFTQEVFIKKNLNLAYEYLHEEFKKVLSKDNFVNHFSKAAEAANVKVLEAISFELIGTTDNLAIYIAATNDRGTGYLKITMYGDGKNYKLIAFKTINSLPKFNHSMAGTYKEAKVIIRREK